MSAIRGDVAQPTPMLRLLQGDVGSGKTAVAGLRARRSGPGRPPGRPARADRPAGPPAPRDGRRPARGARPRRDAADRLAQGRRQGKGARGDPVRPGRRGRRDPRPHPGGGLVRRPRPGRHRRAASLRRRPARPARGQGRRPVAARPADDRDADPADPRPGVLYADLDVSDLRTPPGRARPDPDRDPAAADLEGTWRKVREEAALGHRTFVVVPLIEEGADEADGAVAAESEAVRLRALLDPLRVGMVHGRMKPAERDAEMTRFRDGELDVLVGTTVVEVGVDVPAATMMVIQGADRFGLAQLHQLRGRVGRGSIESFCVLVSDSTDEVAQARPQGRGRDPRRLRAGREGLRAAQGGRRPGPRPERVPAAARRLAPGGRPIATWPSGRAPTPRPCSTRTAELDPPRPALTAELETGWLRRVAAAEPASGA